MDPSRSAPASQAVQNLVRRCQFYCLRWETEFTPCTGITAVTRQERSAYGRLGVMIAPWQSEMAAAQAGLVQGHVEKTDFSFKITGPCVPGTRVQVLITPPSQRMPIVFLSVPGAFQGSPTPYDTPELARDTLIFGVAVAEFLQRIGASPRQFVWGADWQTVPAIVRLRSRHHTVLTLHNEFDAWLAREASEIGGSLFPQFRGQETALRIGMKLADVVTTVNRGYARGLRTEPIHTQVMANHLQDLVWRIVPVENANFNPLHPDHARLEELLAQQPAAGINMLEKSQLEGRAALPEPLKTRIGDRVLVVAMGRRVAQKMHDVIVEATRSVLLQNPDLPLFVVFATVSGDPGTADRLRKQRIDELAQEFPQHVFATDGRLDYYSTLMRAADFNAMTSLYEPHGGVFEGAVVPIVRLIDGLARQVNAFEPTGRAAQLNAAWHETWELPSGIGFREPTTATEVIDLRAFLSSPVAPDNPTFRALVESFAAALLQAVSLRRQRPEVYARLVLGALRAQKERNWQLHLGGILALVEEARLRRPI